MSKRLSSQVQGHGLGGWAGDQNPWATPGAPWKPQQEMFPCPIAILAQAPCHTVLTLPLCAAAQSGDHVDNHSEGVSAQGQGLCLSLPFPRFVSLSPCSATPVGPPDLPPPNICPIPHGRLQFAGAQGCGGYGGVAHTHSRC